MNREEIALLAELVSGNRLSNEQLTNLLADIEKLGIAAQLSAYKGKYLDVLEEVKASSANAETKLKSIRKRLDSDDRKAFDNLFGVLRLYLSRYNRD